MATDYPEAPEEMAASFDLSEEMLNKLRHKYHDRLGQIDCVRQSYLQTPLGKSTYDYVVSAMAMHHLPPAEKLEVHSAIHDALKIDGTYIEGDSVVPEDSEREFLDEYNAYVAKEPDMGGGRYHIDIPFSIGTQLSLFRKAGFGKTDTVWQMNPHIIWDIAVIVAVR